MSAELPTWPTNPERDTTPNPEAWTAPHQPSLEQYADAQIGFQTVAEEKAFEAYHGHAWDDIQPRGWTTVDVTWDDPEPVAEVNDDQAEI